MTARLPARPWMSAPSTRAVIDALEAAGGPDVARFVGGCVRDALLGVERPWDRGALDIDIATRLRPPQVTAALEAAGLRAVPTGVEHGTVTAVADGRAFEITTLRRDVATDGRRAVVAFTDSWGEDAARRDFRLNALYAEPDGTLHDPTGSGVADALAGRVVFVGEPQARIAEDYLRILRFFRFVAGYGRGEADAAALEACARLRGGISRLSGERVSAELLKLLAVGDPRAALNLMAQTGVLEAALPGAAAARLDGLVGSGAEGGAPDPLLRLAALLPGDADAVAAAARRLRLSNAARERLVRACGAGEWVASGPPSPEALRRAVYSQGPMAVRDRLRLAWAADPQAREHVSGWSRALAASDRTPPRFPVTGEEIKAVAGVEEGPAVGALRREVEAWWIENGFPEDREAVIARLKEAVRAASV